MILTHLVNSGVDEMFLMEWEEKMEKQLTDVDEQETAFSCASVVKLSSIRSLSQTVILCFLYRIQVVESIRV